jgi:hypothetical protein
MRKMAVLAVIGAMLVGASSTRAQQPAKPGPEHEMLKILVGTWDTTMKADDKEFKGTMTYKMVLGGLWLAGSLESDLGGMKFHGKSMDTYDAGKKKFIGVWFDSMATTPMMMEGTYDKEKKTMTMTGQGPGKDGKLTTWRSVSTMPDNDTMTMNMYVGDAKESMFTITYKRKK